MKSLKPENDRYRVPAVEKALAILEVLAKSSDGLGISELHAALNIPKATVFMILVTLEQHRIIHKVGAGRYAIGVRLFELGNSFVQHLDIVEKARPRLAHLMATTGLTTHLGILDDGEVLIVDKHEPNSFIRFSSYPGLRSPIHTCSLGKAMSAYLPETELEQIVKRHGMARYTSKTITDLDGFMLALADVRRQGYAIEDEEEEPNIGCIGAPVFDGSGRIAGAISVTGLISQLPPAPATVLGQAVRATADQISVELGAPGSGYLRSDESVGAGARAGA